LSAAPELRVASWNIHKGVGTDRRRDLGRTAAVIAEMAPDILTLQEADTRFGTRRGLLDLGSLDRETGLVPVPVANSGPAHGWHGNLILVRGADVEDVHRIDLPGMEPRGALIADLKIRDARLRVIGTHLGLLHASRVVQARVLMDHLDRLEPRPSLLMGDLNEWRRDGAALRTLARLFDLPRPVESFPSRLPVLPLDRMMASRTSALTEVDVHRSALSRRASDHLPITGRLRIGGDGG
jgi:endonuclease/exonuclease/phosphatase family metal-dependent hydrolase